MKYILINNLGSKQSLLMKFGRFIPYYIRKKNIKKFYKNCNLKTSSRSFCSSQELKETVRKL